MCVLSKGLEGTTFLKEVRTLLTQYVYGWMDVILKLQDNATFLTLYVSFFYCLSFTNTHIFLLLLLLLVRCCLCILKNETFFFCTFCVRVSTIWKQSFFPDFCHHQCFWSKLLISFLKHILNIFKEKLIFVSNHETKMLIKFCFVLFFYFIILSFQIRFCLNRRLKNCAKLPLSRN